MTANIEEMRMRYVYLDNFRGFTKTSVPLLDVNFLVGENSTGKTSLLRAWQLLSNPRIFMGDQPGDEEWPLGHFSEMVSAHSSDQSYFRLGYVFERQPKETVGHGLLVTFQKVRGVPVITRLTCSMPYGEATIRLDGKRVFSKVEKTRPAKNADEAHKRLLGWTKLHGKRRTGEWKEIPDLARAPMFVLLGIASDPSSLKKGEGSFVLPHFLPAPVWVAPIRSRPRRTYDEPPVAYSPEGTHTPYAIRRILGTESEAKRFKEFIGRTGKASGLFEKIEVKHFGESETSPFEVDAYLGNKAFGISWLGYGVSQSLPILVELLDRSKGSWFAIQQPEVHLHPRAQAALGDAFFEMASLEAKRFLIETHSDFTIDRFRMNYRSKKDRSRLPKSQILFFERKEKHNAVSSIVIDANGDLSEDQPQSYRQFFIREEMNMLGLK